MRILVTDGMDKSAMETLRANGHEVVEQFYEPDQLGAEAAVEEEGVDQISQRKIDQPNCTTKRHKYERPGRTGMCRKR